MDKQTHSPTPNCTFIWASSQHAGPLKQTDQCFKASQSRSSQGQSTSDFVSTCYTEIKGSILMWKILTEDLNIIQNDTSEPSKW